MLDPATTPRIAALDPPYDSEIEAQLRKWMPPNSPLEPLALFRTLYVHPELASRMRPLGAGILGHGLIEPREREIVILRTCARCGAEYEWGVHAVAFGQSVGLTEDQITATTRPEDQDAIWSDRDRVLLAFADQLYDTDRVDDELWNSMAAVWAPAQLLELIVTAGWYRTISYVLNAVGVQREPWAAQFLTPSGPDSLG
jgi:alkylhydroperoxidase family enzyme